MKNHFLLIGALVIIIITFSGCTLVGGIFKAGVGVGLFIAVLVIAGIIFLISRLGKNKRS